MWYAFTFYKKDVKFIGNQEQNYSTRLEGFNYNAMESRSSVIMENMVR